MPIGPDQTLKEGHSADRSDPLPVEDLRVARSLSKAIDTFEGDWEHAAEWMRTPNLALDNRPPFEVAREPDGYERVLAVLVRIDHGVYG
jgi:putative toxin-antitoxin system antitoxin component (TIGR02293 family)